MMEIETDVCTGCHACELKCPKQCISMVQDEFGFIYPKVDGSKCIHCDSCSQVCHANVFPKETLVSWRKQHTGYYGWCKDEELVSNSSSGGAFSAIVEEWLDNDGIVFGASYNEDFSYVSHQGYQKNDYAPLRKSKYVFSDLKDSFKMVEKYLSDGKKVLFTGTPCQIGGLRAYLKKDNPNLLTVDFICHGTPSMNFLKQHLDYISKGRKITNVDFRSKVFGWRKHCLKVEMGEKYYIQRMEDDYYLKQFMQYNTLRECCYNCQYSDNHHVSDITIADFWKIKTYLPEYTADKGVSLIIFNHRNPETLFNNLEKRMELYAIPEEVYRYVYKSHDSYDLNKRKQTFRNIKKYGFAQLSKKYADQKIVRKIQKIWKKLIRQK